MAGEIKHSWNGTVLTITSDSGTSSADLQGPKGDIGIRGPQGPAGIGVSTGGSGGSSSGGNSGESYVLTEEDKQEIASMISTSSGKYSEGVPVVAETEEEQRLIDTYQEMMLECNGDYNKIPFLLQTDNHTYFPTNIYNLCGKMMNFPHISGVITLGDIVANYFGEDTLQNFVNAMKPFPIEKKITVAGNHDVWVGSSDRSYIDQAKLSPYLKNYTMKRQSNSGYGVVTDDYFSVKYLIISNYDKERGETGSHISTKQVDFIINELSKNDGYDIVILSHEPISMNDSKTTSLLEAGTYTTMGNYFAFISSATGFATMLANRRDKGQGTYTDNEGITHNYDFTNCKSDLLCCFCGHTHVEGFDFIGDKLLTVAWGGINHASGKPIYFGYIDRKNKYLKYYRVAGDYSATRIVGLNKDSATNMTLDTIELFLDKGQTKTITPLFSPITTGNQRVTWSSSNPSAITVKKGFVTAVGASGSSTITAVAEDGNHTATCVVTVNDVVLKSISATYSGGRVDVGTNISTLTGVVVTGTYSDGSTATIPSGFTLSSGTIVEGENIITVSYKGLTTTITVEGKVKVNNSLPAEYQEVDYLYTESYNVAHIPTTTELKAGDKGYLTVMARTYSSEQAFCGKPSYADIYVTGASSGSTFSDWAKTTLVSPAKGTACVDNTDYDIEFNITGDFTNLFLMAYDNSSKYGMIGRMYSARFTRDGVDIYNFVPCYRKSDNAPGMYDTVNNTFTAGVGVLFAS
jgi:hypothetical protein